MELVVIFDFSGSPRLSPYLKTITDIERYLGENAILTVHIIAHPEPDPSNYTWMKCTEASCNRLNTDETLIIYSNGLESNLIFKNVQEDQFGKYKVLVGNGVGRLMEETFYLSERGG